jgi:SM-20-related protein
VSVKVDLEGGYSHELNLKEDSEDLMALFRVLASRGTETAPSAEQFFQLPMDQGRAACSFSSKQLISITTRPPVVIQIEQATPPAQRQTLSQPADPVTIQSPVHVVIDDFLSQDEHKDMLAYALKNEDQFNAATVTSDDASYRQNLVIMNFHEAAHSRLLCNRLLTWFPQLTKMLGQDVFPLKTVESQLTASNDGHYFRAHRDSGDPSTKSRALSCVYYFFREPRAFAGGNLRLYDNWQQGNDLRSADSFTEIQPVSNRLVVFPSQTHHELMRIRCPSRQFEDSRFAITSWIHRTDTPDSNSTFGWGHYHCGLLPKSFALPKENSR